MATSKPRRRGLSHPIFQLGLGTASLGLLCAFGVSIQQQPPQEGSPKSQQETVPPPLVELPRPTPGEDYSNDPLFQEIKKIVQQGSTPSMAATSPNTPTDSISNSRWHAVESILAAARVLEKEVAECIERNDVEGAAKTQRAIRSLRTQVFELLH